MGVPHNSIQNSVFLYYGAPEKQRDPRRTTNSLGAQQTPINVEQNLVMCSANSYFFQTAPFNIINFITYKGPSVAGGK